MQNRDDDSEPTAAERAFEALRAEVAGMRQAMQSLPDVIKKSRAADYTETLGAIAKKLEIMGAHALELRDPLWASTSAYPIGSVLEVKWKDGSTATVKRMCFDCTIIWAILPDTLKNADGKSIDSAGNVIQNPNLIAGSPVGGPFTETSMPDSPTIVTFIPDNLPSGTVTIEWPDGTTSQDGIILPPGG